MLLIFEIFQKEEGIVLLLPLVTTRSYFDCPSNLLNRYLVLLHTVWSWNSLFLYQPIGKTRKDIIVIY